MKKIANRYLMLLFLPLSILGAMAAAAGECISDLPRAWRDLKERDQ